MKKFIGTFEIKKASFYQNSLENMTFSAENRKDAIKIGRIYARHNELKFISIRIVK